MTAAIRKSTPGEYDGALLSMAGSVEAVDTLSAGLAEFRRQQSLGQLPELVNPWACGTCEDRGWLFDGKIECSACGRVARMRRAKFAQLGPIDGDYDSYTFETYPARSAQTLVVRDELRKLSAPTSVLLHGPVGSGKTSLGTCLYHAWQDAGTAGMWFTTIDLLGHIRAGFDRETRTYTADALVEAICTVPLLLLDDVGAEKVTDWVAEQLFNVISRREKEHRATIFTSNLGLDRLAARFEDPMGERIASRIRGMCERRIYKVDGPDLRGLLEQN